VDVGGGMTFSPCFLKNISSVFLGSALRPAHASHLMQVVYPDRIAVLISSHSCPHAKIAPSFTYILRVDLLHACILWRRGDV
jgi:hypothetical protein